jgi:hypothetical protein
MYCTDVNFQYFPDYYPSGQVGYVAFYTVFLIANQMKGKKSHKLIPVLWFSCVSFNLDVFLLRKRNFLQNQ